MSQHLARLLLIFALLFIASPTFYVANGAPVKLTAEDLKDGVAELEDEAWAYRFGDDGRWAAKDYDDTTWATSGFDEAVSSRGVSPDGARWDGVAWFRVRLDVDENLANQPLALRVQHWGASEIYIDGKLIRRFGEIRSEGDTEYNPRSIPVAFVFTEGGSHTLAIRYSYKAARDSTSGVGRWLMHAKMLPGFYAFIQPAGQATESYGRRILYSRGNRLFVGILVALALLHFLLYLYYRRERANLFYSIFAFSLAITLPLNNLFNGDDPFGARTAIIAAICFVSTLFAFACGFVSLLAFLYVAFDVPFGKRFRALFLLWLAAMIIGVIYVREYITLYVFCFCLALTLIEAAVIMVRALIRRRDGAWIIMAGLSLFAFGMCVTLSRELIVYRIPSALRLVVDIFILLAVPIAVSVFLARNFARTNLNLEAQLGQVKDLSARQLELERERAELKIKHEQTRLENERRAQELEEARQLQLSMLPAKLPNLPNLEIAVYMKPASEVGGDYYDFHLAPDGTLTVIIGDATGHGLKAGTVVTATKSLFNAFADEPDIITFFRTASRALKAMNLRGLFMAMTMIKIKDGTLSISAAGMPPMLVFRHATNTVEEVALNGMPLGSVLTFPYKQRTLELSTGDAVMLMSDGFPERFNPQDEMIDYDQAKTILAGVAHESPQAIINHFVQVGDSWAQDRVQDDDVTFVVLKVTVENKAEAMELPER
ncbi:MAG: SpoIIE family protein phosphatase [Pyrinomonadaceae bacterium MAG19_C2-C3]|nr:SpoIIE family protein phosphatase [Pyrinomonadaceae bacterium MAG19_C2-C3]